MEMDEKTAKFKSEYKGKTYSSVRRDAKKHLKRIL
jgi:hypothetical protein